MDSIPLVVITGQVATPLIGKDGFQEADVVGITVPLRSIITRFESCITNCARSFTSPKRAPGPVLIDIPKDVQNAKVTGFNEEVDIPGYKPEFVPDSMET